MMNWIEIDWNGKKVRVPALRAQGKIWVHWQGETHVIELSGGSRRPGAERGKAHPGVLMAPMPGKITKVAASVGTAVKKGQTLVVMEAMKMEYTLEADRDGRVTEVHATVGQQVALGHVLVRVGEA